MPDQRLRSAEPKAALAIPTEHWTNLLYGACGTDMLNTQKFTSRMGTT